MAHDRSLFAHEISRYPEPEVQPTPDDFEGGLPEDGDDKTSDAIAPYLVQLLIQESADTEVVEHVEITQRQVSLAVAVAMLISFAFVMVGIGIAHGVSAVHEQHSLMPSEPVVVLRDDRQIIHHGSRFSSWHEADAVRTELARQGVVAYIHQVVSRTSQGNKYTWYDIIMKADTSETMGDERVL